jgi:hypothetical protein
MSALLNQTSAGNQVFSNRNWPETTDLLGTGVILVYALKERKESVPSGLPLFNTWPTIDVMVRVARGGPETAIAIVDKLVDEIETAVINSWSTKPFAQRIVSIESDIGVSSEGEMAGVAQALVRFEFQDFISYPLDGIPLTEIQVNPPEGSFGSFDIPIPQDSTP